MKRVITFCLALIMVVCLTPVSVHAEKACSDSGVIYFSDGSYLVTSVDEFSARASGSKTGSAIYTYYNDIDVAQWEAKLTASFTYNGTSATCTSANCNVTIYNSNCYVESNNTTRSGNTATTVLVVGRKFLGLIPTFKDTYTIALACDKNGNLYQPN